MNVITSFQKSWSIDHRVILKFFGKKGISVFQSSLFLFTFTFPILVKMFPHLSAGIM